MAAIVSLSEKKSVIKNTIDVNKLTLGGGGSRENHEKIWLETTKNAGIKYIEFQWKNFAYRWNRITRTLQNSIFKFIY